MLALNIRKGIHTGAKLYLIGLVCASLLCMLDYETVSLAHSWGDTETRRELLLVAGLLAVMLTVTVLVSKAVFAVILGANRGSNTE